LKTPYLIKAYCLTVIVALLFTLPSCNNTGKPPVQTRVSSVDSADINLAIKNGQRLVSNKSDSLLAVAQQLGKYYQLTGDKKAKVYAGIFESNYYWFAGNHQQAMKLIMQALANAEKWKIQQLLPEIYTITANLHKENANYDQAFKDALKGLEIARANRDTGSVISLLGLRAMFTHSYYLRQHRAKDDHASLGMQFEALKLAGANPKYEKMTIRFYNNIAQAYKDDAKYDHTIFYGNKAVLLATKYNQQRSLTYSYCWLGQAFYYMGQHEKGLKYLNMALTITRQIKQPFRQMEVYEAIMDCYRSTGDFKEAFNLLERVAFMRDSLQVTKNVKQISELQLKYESVKKDQQIGQLNQSAKVKNRELFWIIVISFIFLIMFMIILIQYYTIHKHNKLIKGNNTLLQQALVKIAYIQSHEVRKPLASILGLINIIKDDNYEATKDTLVRMETSALKLDEKIKDIIFNAEIIDSLKEEVRI
jgi:tetratricopeptide (TPR) repeat protein